MFTIHKIQMARPENIQTTVSYRKGSFTPRFYLSQLLKIFLQVHEVCAKPNYTRIIVKAIWLVNGYVSRNILTFVKWLGQLVYLLHIHVGIYVLNCVHLIDLCTNITQLNVCTVKFMKIVTEQNNVILADRCNLSRMIILYNHYVFVQMISSK